MVLYSPSLRSLQCGHPRVVAARRPAFKTAAGQDWCVLHALHLASGSSLQKLYLGRRAGMPDATLQKCRWVDTGRTTMSVVVLSSRLLADHALPGADQWQT